VSDLDGCPTFANLPRLAVGAYVGRKWFFRMLSLDAITPAWGTSNRARPRLAPILTDNRPALGVEASDFRQRRVEFSSLRSSAIVVGQARPPDLSVTCGGESTAMTLAHLVLS